MGYKLGKESRKIRTPQNTPIFRKKLDGGTIAEANNDGTINIDKRVPVGSKKFVKAIKHELQHMNDMESGRAQYGDEWVMWEDRIYLRKTINGTKVIDGPNGRWEEGSPNHPWEQVAIEAEKE
jgi:hypothetical protein